MVVSNTLRILDGLGPDDNPQHVTVYALIPGHFHLPDKEVFQDALTSSSGNRVPTFAFLIDHPAHGKLLFDLGLRKHGKGYPPAWDETLAEFKPECDYDAADLLRGGGVDPADITSVVLSHLHFDHTGDITPFTSAEIIVGADARPLFDKPYPKDPESLFQEWPEGVHVNYIEFSSKNGSPTNATDAASTPPIPKPDDFLIGKPNSQLEPLSTDDNHPSAQTRPTPRHISPLGEFEHALDLFSDGSFYLIDAPGHSPGHVMALARVIPDGFILLAADCCHNRQCYSPGDRLISQWNYEDLPTARETVRRLARMNRDAHNVVVVLAHEHEREREMPLFPQPLTEWVAGEIDKKKKLTGQADSNT